MNKIKSLFFLLFCITLFAVSFAPPASAQDYKLGLGKAWLRYDADSNVIKFGATGLPPKIAREFNSPLFNFNANQFFWSNLTGLNLTTDARHDTTIAYHLIIQKDTGDGEFTPYNKRSYTFYKPFYANAFDFYDLIVRYESATDTIPYRDINLFNNSYILFDNQEMNQELSNNTWGEYITLPKRGKYFIIINYEYEFPEIVGLNSIEFLEVTSTNVNTCNTLGSNHHKYYRVRDALSGETNSATLSFIQEFNNSNGSFNSVTFTGTSESGNSILLKKLRIIAILIN